MTTAAWPNPERYARHRALWYRRPATNGRRPWLIEQAQRRLEPLVTHRAGALPWKVTGIRVPDREHRGASALSARLGGRLLHYHDDRDTRHGHQRLRRDQILHTTRLLLGYYLDRTNVQAHRTGDRALGWLELRETSLDSAADDLGLARSTVAAAEALLRKCGLLRTRQRREHSETGQYRQRPSQRWLTPHLFALLGLSRAYVRQLGHRPAKDRPGGATGAPAQRAPADAGASPKAERTPPPEERLDALRGAVGRRKKMRP